MNRTLAVLFFSTILFVTAASSSAQNIPPPTGSAAPTDSPIPAPTGEAYFRDGGCGPDKTSFEVKSNDSQHPVSQPPAGKALVYFIQDDADYPARPRPTTRWGIDGSWIGATQANSYFYIAIDPGPHQLCTTWQNASIVTHGRRTAATEWTAEAGATYYFMVQDLYWENPTNTAMRLGGIIPEEAQLRMSKLAYTTFTEKK
jgi:hypothetical protein